MARQELGTILLVEDDPSDTTLLCRAFERARVLNPIKHMDNGDDALLYLEGRQQFTDRSLNPLPILILLDLKLPGMTGFQLLQWMRTRPEISRIPMVVLTSDNSPETINAAYDLGANSYLVKSGDPAQIQRIVGALNDYWIKLNEAPKLVTTAQQR
jgi:CheY-like chemotaxis protein